MYLAFIPIKRKNIICYILLSFTIFSTAYFCINMVIGNRGLITLFSLQSNLKEQFIILDNTIKIKNNLKYKNTLLQKENPDIDLLDEQVRSILGYIESDELVLLLN